MESECVRAQLSALLDGELEPTEAALTERHLGSCAACRSRMSLLVTLRGAVSDLAGEGVSPEFGASFAKRLARERQGAAVSARRSRATWRLVGLATAATLSLLVIWFAARVRPPSARQGPALTAAGAAFVLPAMAPGLDCGVDAAAEEEARPCASARSCGSPLATTPGLPGSLRAQPACVRADSREDGTAGLRADRPVSRLDRGDGSHG
jgi:anti-sigma factor RsiW